MCKRLGKIFKCVPSIDVVIVIAPIHGELAEIVYLLLNLYRPINVCVIILITCMLHLEFARAHTRFAIR